MLWVPVNSVIVEQYDDVTLAIASLNHFQLELRMQLATVSYISAYNQLRKNYALQVLAKLTACAVVAQLKLHDLI